jgi:hypothetical protein
MNEREEQDFLKQLIVATTQGLAGHWQPGQEKTLATAAVSIAHAVAAAYRETLPKPADWLE